MRFYSAPASTAWMLLATLPLISLGLYAAVTELSIFGMLLTIVGIGIFLFMATSVVVVDDRSIRFERLLFPVWQADLSEVFAEDGVGGDFGVLPALVIVRNDREGRAVVGAILKTQFSKQTIETVRSIVTARN